SVRRVSTKLIRQTRAELLLFCFVLRSQIAKRGQLRRMCQPLREPFDVASHSRMPEFQVMKFAHLVDSLLRCPAFKRNAVRRDEHAAAVSSQPAMNENFPPRSFLHQ